MSYTVGDFAYHLGLFSGSLIIYVNIASLAAVELYVTVDYIGWWQMFGPV